MSAVRPFAVQADPRSRRSKNCENGRFQSLIFSASMHVIKRLTVNYDTPRQYLIFFRQIFDVRPRLASCDLQS